jgi:hypothetical protein
MGDGTLRLERRWNVGGLGFALPTWTGRANEPWTIAIDGTTMGVIAYRETVEMAVAPGHHTLRLGQGRHLSPERSFDVGPEEVVSFYYHGPRYGWLQILAALVKSDLWITLRRE